jgi:hypothetical protein
LYDWDELAMAAHRSKYDSKFPAIRQRTPVQPRKGLAEGRVAVNQRKPGR